MKHIVHTARKRKHAFQGAQGHNSVQNDEMLALQWACTHHAAVWVPFQMAVDDG
jgi:hypothetical protein